MVEICSKCHDHSDEKLCRKCNTCQRQHVMKFGIPWVQDTNNHDSNEPCPHIARFQLPNKVWIEYKCVLKLKHKGACDFGNIKKQVERMARDC